MPEIAEREAKETSVWRFRFSLPFGAVVCVLAVARAGWRCGSLRFGKVASLRSVKTWRVVATAAGSDEMVFFTPS